MARREDLIAVNAVKQMLTEAVRKIEEMPHAHVLLTTAQIKIDESKRMLDAWLAQAQG